MPEIYHAPIPLPEASIVVGTPVIVPEWLTGTVIGWTPGVVFDINRPTGTPVDGPTKYDTAYYVRMDNGREQLYFAYSIGDPTRMDAWGTVAPTEPQLYNCGCGRCSLFGCTPEGPHALAG